MVADGVLATGDNCPLTGGGREPGFTVTVAAARGLLATLAVLPVFVGTPEVRALGSVPELGASTFGVPIGGLSLADSLGTRLVAAVR